MSERVPVCPHCQQELTPWRPPEDMSWGLGLRFVCFNDDCPYHVRGWEHMSRTYEVNASYRYCFNPATGKSMPLPVWSKNAHRDRIVTEEEISDD